ncbi:hypothetical protein N7465_000266 [Penicillium sp. CMV-2018d]|nr:hypothetical protein N7465_000266 [Penicillium sp. CMV-2018d]
MSQPTHIIDPDGEMIIILRNADSPFAQALEDTVNGMRIPESGHCVQSPPEVIDPSPEVFGPPQPHSRRPKMKGKKKKKSSAIWTPPVAEPLSEPAAYPEPTPMEEPVAEPAPEPAASPEPAPIKDPAPEQHVADQPDVEEAAVEEEICEPLDETCFYIQVSAKHMIFASPVFKRILTGGWKESIAYLEKGSVEITAENWDIEAFLVVLHAIHGKYKDIPRKLTLEMLAKVAVIADYYECKESLYLITDIWVNSMEEKVPATYSRDVILWLWVSWFFQIPSWFKESTSAVMSCSENVIGGWELPIPDKVIELMNKSREEAINNLVHLLHATLEAFLSRSRGCRLECSSIMYGALAIHMESIHILSPKPAGPFPNLNYNDLRQKVLSFGSPPWCEIYSRHGSSHVCHDSSFRSLFQDLDYSIEGLNLVSLNSL